MADWRKSGKPLAEMGYIKFQGFRETCWQPGVFTRWIIANKLEAEVKYDYDLAEKKKNQMGVINFNKKLKLPKNHKFIFLESKKPCLRQGFKCARTQI